MLILLLFSVHSILQAQDLSGSCVLKYTKSYFSDTRDYVIAPFKWNANQALLYGSFLSLGVGVYFADDWINKQTSAPNDAQEKVIKYGLSYFGNGFYTMPMMAGMFFYGLSAKKELPFQTALTGVKSFVIATLLGRSFKYVFNRSRPNELQGSQFWGGPFNSFSLSFPSGHTIGAFAVASVVAKNYAHKKWVPITSYTLAFGVGLSRVWTKNHWASDVVFGALLGWSVGTVVSKVECNKNDTGFKLEGSGFAYKF